MNEISLCCQQSKGFLKLFDSFMSQNVLPSDCIELCEIYWNTSAKLEHMSTQIQDWKDNEKKLAEFEEKLLEVQTWNDEVRERIKSIEQKICSCSHRKEHLVHQIVKNKGDIQCLQSYVKEKFASKSRIESQLTEYDVINSTQVSASALESKINELKAKDKFISGMLLHLGKPLKDEYSAALLSVLGRKAKSTVVVENRLCAVSVAESLKNIGLSCSAILISGEMNDRFNNVLNVRQNNKLIPLLDAVRVSNRSSHLVYANLLSGWYLYQGSALEYKSSTKFSQKASIVCLDGCQFLCDGEISLKFHKYNSTGEKSNRISNNDYWPTETVAVDPVLYRDLQHEIDNINLSIMTTEEQIIKLISNTKEMEKTSHDIDLSISEDLREVSSLKATFMPAPTRPSTIDTEASQNISQYEAVKAEQHRLRGEIASFISETSEMKFYKGKDVTDLLLLIPTHKHQLIKGQSEIRLVDAAINFLYND